MLGITGFLMIAGVLAAVVSTVFSIWLLVIAFRRHVLWGLASLLLPFAAVVFAIRYWEEAKKPFLYSLTTGLAASFFFIAGAVVGVGAASERIADALNERAALERAAAQPTPEAGSPETTAEPEPVPASPAPEPVPAPASLPPDVVLNAGPVVAGGFSYDPAKVTRDGYVPVSLREAQTAVGRVAKVVDRNGQTHYGQLLHADAAGLELQRSLGGGLVSYRLSGARIESILVDVRN